MSSKITLTGPLKPVDKTVLSKAINHGSHGARPAHAKLSKVEREAEEKREDSKRDSKTPKRLAKL